MPRPPLKRNKLNHPTPSERVANASKISSVAELQQKLADKPVGRVLTDSDDSDKLVTSKRNGRNRGGIPRKEIYASGGVGLGDVPGAHRSQKKQSQVNQRVGTRTFAAKEKTVAATQKGSGGGAAKPAVKDQPPTTERRNPPIQAAPIVLGSTAISRAPTRLQNTPARDTSILGTIKPRRRQASILQLLGNNDSSNMQDEDEDDFLPNDESTPLQHSNALATTSTPNSSLSHSSTSRKRKLTPPTTLVPTFQPREESPLGHSQDADAADEPRSETQLPPPRRSGAALLRVTPRPDDAEIMAPPLSSSPLKSPGKTIIHSPVKKAPGKSRKQPLAPSTSELLVLMPTRRQRKGRLRTQSVSEFDIPADTSNDDSDRRAGPTIDSDDDEDLSFRAETRSRKSNAAARKKAKPDRMRTNGRVKGREKSTISPTKLVTPLKRTPAQKSAAKSSLSQQQPPPHSHGSSITTSTKGNAKTKATYSSSRRHHHDISGDKENRPVDSSDAFSGGEGSLAEERGDDSFELSIEDVEKIQPTKEIQSIVKKFADVDEWEMEFEDVSLGGNSSPNRR